VGCVADLAAELGGEGLERLAERRLGDQLERALGERVHGTGAVGGGEGRDDDDRHMLCLARAQRAKNADPVHAGHVQVERHGVRAVRPAGLEGLVAVGGGGDDIEPLAPERVGQQAAHEPRIVGDDYAHLPSRRG
jgi:hypothetical protein